MARGRRKKALYEVIARNRSKPVYEKIDPVAGRKDTSDDTAAPSGSDLGTRQLVAGWPRRPRLLQFNAGRMELSLPYPLAIALLLTGILMLIISFRLGQFNPVPAVETPSLQSSNPQQQTAPGSSFPVITAESAPRAPVQTPVGEPVRGSGGNRIVIKQHPERRHLEPVQRFFAENGIQTEILQRSSGYFLVTKNTYNNPNRPGTDGFTAKKEIIEKGSRYKAPQGYESFAPTLFSDAYGEKVN